MTEKQLSLADIRLSPKVRRRINERYREQMRKWCPSLVQSHASPAAKGLMVMLTDLWEKKGKSPKPERKPRRRRSKGQNGGYGVYDVRVLRRFGEWLKQVEVEGSDFKGLRANKTATTQKVLSLIPFDNWVLSNEIAEQLGITPRRVGSIVRHRLITTLIERKIDEKTNRKRYLYRRIR